MSITIDLLEWQKASFATHQQLAGAKLPEDEYTQQVVQELAESGRLKIIQHYKGLLIETSSYVGRITVGHIEITIRPKIKSLPLLHLMQYAYDLRQITLSSSIDFSIDTFTFQDLLIYQLMLEVSELLARGLHQHYVRRDEILINPRGSIAIQEIARQGGIVQSALPCTHYLRLEDCLINQVLLQGVRLGIQITNDEQLRLKLQRLEHFHLSSITSVKLDQHLLHSTRRAMNRLTAKYLPALTLIELLWASIGISVDKPEEAVRVPGFLLDMNLFFQSLLSRFLKEHLPEYEIHEQHELVGMMTYIDNPKKRQPPKLRPDYLVQRKGKAAAILDAKYRDLWQETLPPGMLYQLAMYALSQEDCASATILYPTLIPSAEDARIEICLPNHQPRNVYVILRPVDLLHLDRLLRGRRELNNQQERICYAQELVNGRC